MVTILRKMPGYYQESFLGICGNSQKSFTGKSSENVNNNLGELLTTHSEEYLVTHSGKFCVTHSKKFLETRSEELIVTHPEEFLATNSRKFLVTNSAEKSEKMSTKFFEILPAISSSEPIPGNFLGTIPKIFSRVPQESFLRKAELAESSVMNS